MTAIGEQSPFVSGWTQTATQNGDRVDVIETGADVALMRARYSSLRIDPRYGNVTLVNNEGQLRLTYSYGDGTIESGPDTSDPVPVWEILPSDVEVPVAVVKDVTAGLDTALESFRRGVKATGLAADPQAIHDLLWKGVQSGLRTRLVLQKSFECGSSSVERLSAQTASVCAAMDTAVKFGDAGGPGSLGCPDWMKARLAQVPGWSESGKQWLCRFPQIRTTDPRRGRYAVSVQWVWSAAWSAFLYGGNGNP